MSKGCYNLPSGSIFLSLVRTLLQETRNQKIHLREYELTAKIGPNRVLKGHCPRLNWSENTLYVCEAYMLLPVCVVLPRLKRESMKFTFCAMPDAMDFIIFIIFIGSLLSVCIVLFVLYMFC